jgi:protein farnesyltransferase/geranylgeranyltransferase type-1 subunit alpha
MIFEKFGDVIPVLQDDGPNPVAPISYPEEYRIAMDYLRACLRSDEKSERLLQLTAFILDINSGHYTVW